METSQIQVEAIKIKSVLLLWNQNFQQISLR